MLAKGQGHVSEPAPRPSPEDPTYLINESEQVTGL